MDVQMTEGRRAVLPPPAAERAERAERAAEARRPQGERRPAAAPAMDEYVPEEKREPTGLYWPGRDREGRPKIYFDGPEQEAPRTAAAGPEQDREAEGPEGSGGKAERCTADTGRADREIERLKKQKQELEQQLGRETDAEKVRDLERRLAQVERELRRKDSDAYRRQHTTFS